MQSDGAPIEAATDVHMPRQLAARGDPRQWQVRGGPLPNGRGRRERPESQGVGRRRVLAPNADRFCSFRVGRSTPVDLQSACCQASIPDSDTFHFVATCRPLCSPPRGRDRVADRDRGCGLGRRGRHAHQRQSDHPKRDLYSELQSFILRFACRVPSRVHGRAGRPRALSANRLRGFLVQRLPWPCRPVPSLRSRKRRTDGLQAPADGRLTRRPSDLPELDAHLALDTPAHPAREEYIGGMLKVTIVTCFLAALLVAGAACGGGGSDNGGSDRRSPPARPSAAAAFRSPIPPNGV